jgi:two-component system sensor histidine kinase KdpD
VSSLRSKDIAWSEQDRDELLESAEGALDRLTDLVTNLLDLSRVHAGVLSITPTPVGLDDVVSRALDNVTGLSAVVRRDTSTDAKVEVDIPDGLPEVLADGVLLERVVANLVDNALRYSPPNQPIRVAASGYGDTLELRVVDRGPGIPPADRDAVFAPFQRRGDTATSTSAGVGLGLAIARAFTEAMNGALTLEDTPGGGLTAVVALPRAPGSAPQIATASIDLLGDAGT